MGSQELHRGRRIDHIQLVVADIEAVFHGEAERSAEWVGISF